MASLAEEHNRLARAALAGLEMKPGARYGVGWTLEHTDLL